MQIPKEIQEKINSLKNADHRAGAIVGYQIAAEEIENLKEENEQLRRDRNKNVREWGKNKY